MSTLLIVLLIIRNPICVNRGRAMGVVTIFLLFSHLHLVFSLTFINVTNTIGLGRTAPTRVVAYSDFNADKATDILVVTDNGERERSRMYSSSRRGYV